MERRRTGPGADLKGGLGSSESGLGARLVSAARASTRSKPRVRTDMPDAPLQARRFGKTRAERSAALLEDYVELIADLFAANGEARATDVARRIGVTHPTALKNIARLRR